MTTTVHSSQQHRSRRRLPLLCHGRRSGRSGGGSGGGSGELASSAVAPPAAVTARSDFLGLGRSCHVLPPLFFCAVSAAGASTRREPAVIATAVVQTMLSLLCLLKRLRPQAAPYVAWLGGAEDLVVFPVIGALLLIMGVELRDQSEGRVASFFFRHGILFGLLQAMAASAIAPSNRLAALLSVVCCSHLYVNRINTHMERFHPLLESVVSATLMVALPMLVSSRMAARAKLKSS
mmetsp:Transcript_17707/g.57282  ORF Transcript_17707/g.57282 Transcript_17707/m.57282 type:complete len:235 (+) Transcript_17707:94-798(+)